MVAAPLLAAALVAAPPAPTVRAAAIQDSPVSLSVTTKAKGLRLTCSVDGGRARTCSRSLARARTLRLALPPARHVIAVRAVDRRGRASAARSVVVVVPERAPAPVQVGGDPVGLAASGSDLWVSGGSAGTVARVDASSRRVTGTITVGGQLGGIAATPSAVWVSDFGAGAVVRIDPARNAVAARVTVGGQPTGVAVADDGSVWVANLAGYLSHLDASGHELVRVPLSSGASTVLLARGLVWAGLQDGSLVAIQPGGSLDGTPVPLAPDVDALADSPSGIWAATFEGLVGLLDPSSRTVVHRTRLVSRGSGIAFAGGSIWASAYDSALVVRLDPATGALLGAVHAGERPRDLAVAAGLLWVADEQDGALTPIPLG